MSSFLPIEGLSPLAWHRDQKSRPLVFCGAMQILDNVEQLPFDDWSRVLDDLKEAVMMVDDFPTGDEYKDLSQRRAIRVMSLALICENLERYYYLYLFTKKNQFGELETDLDLDDSSSYFYDSDESNDDGDDWEEVSVEEFNLNDLNQVAIPYDVAKEMAQVLTQWGDEVQLFAGVDGEDKGPDSRDYEYDLAIYEIAYARTVNILWDMTAEHDEEEANKEFQAIVGNRVNWSEYS